MSDAPSLMLGAHLEPQGVTFRCFAAADSCSVQLLDPDGGVLVERALEPLGGGYFEGVVPEAQEGSLYFFIVNGRSLPDPYARFLPQGVHGPARVERANYTRQHAAPPRKRSELVIYELHIGTFTPAGTFAAAAEHLPHIAELGVTAIELMPVAAFAGERGWGYDGVALYAPHAAYGTPDDLRYLVDEAHRLGLSVLLDVVYNHFGPAGNYLAAYAPEYFSPDAHNDWGQAPNFAHPVVRRLMLENARYWLEEFGFDGLRLDATHAIVDTSERHLLEDLVALARACEPPRWLFAEDDRNHAALITHTGMSAQWADDFHHQTRATLTAQRAGYFAAYEPSVQGIADVINRGWLYSGQFHPVRKKPRGTSADALAAEEFVYCIQNHDQIGNRAFGDRFPQGDLYRAASLLLLFLPMTPLLFMGQEYAATTPFLYFTDHDAELGRLVREGRRREFAEFFEFSTPQASYGIPDPQARGTFFDSKLSWTERLLPEQARTLELYRKALALRHSDPVWSHASRSELHAEVLQGALVVQRSRGTERRVLIMNTSDRVLPLAALAEALNLTTYDVLIASSAVNNGFVAPNSAVVVSGAQS